MTFIQKTSLASALALVLVAGAAVGQPAQGGRGAALKAACGADIQTFCPHLGLFELRACMRKNFHSLSDGCQALLRQMRSQRPPQGAGGPPQ